MAELQMRLKQYDKSEKTINQALEVEAINHSNLTSMLTQAKLLNLLAKVRLSIFVWSKMCDFYLFIIFLVWNLLWFSLIPLLIF